MPDIPYSTPSSRNAPRSTLHASREGFTFIELLVSLMITALLSGFVITYTSRGRIQTTLYIEQAKLGQLIVRAKSFAISTYGTGASICGYGLHVDPLTNSYALFSYTNENCDAIISIDPLDSVRYKEFQRYSLSPGIAFSEEIGQVGDIFFIPPDPKTLIWKDGTLFPSGTGEISLVDKSGSGKITVQVSTAGQISF